MKMKDYRSRFGFHANPFTRELATQDRFGLEAFDEAIEAVLTTLEARMSCALIAPAGTAASISAASTCTSLRRPSCGLTWPAISSAWPGPSID